METPGERFDRVFNIYVVPEAGKMVLAIVGDDISVMDCMAYEIRVRRFKTKEERDEYLATVNTKLELAV